MNTKFGEVWSCNFRNMQAHRQTISVLSQYFATLPWTPFNGSTIIRFLPLSRFILNYIPYIFLFSGQHTLKLLCQGPGVPFSSLSYVFNSDAWITIHQQILNRLYGLELTWWNRQLTRSVARSLYNSWASHYVACLPRNTEPTVTSVIVFCDVCW